MSIDTTTVGTKQALALAGTDMSPFTTTDSYQNESATAIDFGVPVARGTATASIGGPAEVCKPFGADTDEAIGVSLRDATDNAVTNAVTYGQWKAVPVKKSGRVAVYAAEAVRKGDQVLILTAGASVPTTAFGSSKNGVAGAGRIAFSAWKWCFDTAAGAIGFIEQSDAHIGRATT